MSKTCKTLTALTIVFGSAMIIFLCLFISFLTTSNNYRIQLENSYMKSFYEMVDNVNSLEVDLSKIVATNNITSQRELLSGYPARRADPASRTDLAEGRRPSLIDMTVSYVLVNIIQFGFIKSSHIRTSQPEH